MNFRHPRSIRFAFYCAASAACSFAQPSSPSLAEVDQLRAMSERDPKIQSDGEPWSVDLGNREEARQFYLAIYGASEGVPSEWNGNTTTGNPGTTSAAFKEAVRNRVNFYRAYAGVPASVIFNATFSAKAQQAALMFSANKSLTHTPPSSWTHYTAGGDEAAGASNIGIGSFGMATMDGYMRDHGPGNTRVGHRRWILYPQTMEMGTGDVEVQGDFPAAQALWVQDSKVFDARPNTRDDFVAWPPKGHVPHQLVWPRWSLSYPGADFSNATIAMTRDGAPISATIEERVNATGAAPEPTLIWLYDGKTGNDLASHSRPSADVDYEVTVGNVVVNGSPRTFNYTVTVINPRASGNDTVPTAISGTSTPGTGGPSAYSVTVPSFGSGFYWRELALADFNTTYGAEGGLQGLVATTTGSYPARVTDVTASGNGAYHLTHESGPSADQLLTLPASYYVPANSAASLQFSSRLRGSTNNQVAEVHISADDGQTWNTEFAQLGESGTQGESAFSTKTVDLSSYARSTIRVRFAYRVVDLGSFVIGPQSFVGWLFDNVQLSGVKTATVQQSSAHQSGVQFNYTATSTGAKALQARGAFYGTYPMEWGPALEVNADAGNGSGSGGGNTGGTSRIINLSVRANAASGVDGLNVGMVVGGSGSKSLLMRVVGPTLGQAPFNLPGTAPDPALQVFTNGSVVAENDNWSNALTANFNAVGAFALVNGSKDAALLTSLPNGPHPALVNTKGQSGVVIVEAYDTQDVTSGTARLINVSARNRVGTGSDVLIAGFVIGGNANKTVLIRGVGATLGQAPFNLPGVLANPQLVVKPLGSDTVVASNDNWNNNTQIASVASTLGAFALSSTSDAAVLVTLAPGGYTATVSGVNDTTGIAIVEIYEVD